MEAAALAGAETVAVVSCDIVGYSKTPDDDQVRRVTAINELVSAALRRSRPEQVVWSSGGDGGHIVFRGDGWQRTTIQLMWELLTWARAEDIGLRISGHVGPVTSIWGADGRIQVVGSGINFASWLLRQFSREGVVVSDTFRRAVPSADIELPIGFHDERLFVDRNSEPQLLYLMSVGEFRSAWLGADRDDHVSLRDSVDHAASWDVLYFVKRIWQVNSKDKQATTALKRVAGMLGSDAGDQQGLLASMWYEELADFIRIGQLVERAPGEVICRFGDPGESMFVILRGEVGVYNIEGEGFGGSASPKHVHRKGEVVGELASVLNRDRTADLVALTDVALLAFNYEEIKQKLPSSPTTAFDRFVTERVLEHTSQVTPFLVGPNRTGPLSVISEAARLRVGVETAWRDALVTLQRHSQLITVDAGPLDLRLDHVLTNSEDRDGLYILVSGSLRSPGSTRSDLNGAQCPVLWTDVPNLLNRPPASYGRELEPIKILRIGAAGINNLELAQRWQLRNALEHPAGTDPHEFEYQVYLCHSSQDKGVVRQIRDGLEQSGIRCWFDEDELLVGASARRRMEQGLLSSRYILVCASGNLQSALWADQEIDAVLHLDVERRTEPKVLVLKLNDDSVEASIPVLLRGKKWLEYQRPGDFERLIDFLRPPIC